MKKIYLKDWMKLHPYTKTDSIDQYYVRVANEILLILDRHLDSVDRDWREYTALILTGWFEDVISQTGIWQTFTGECEKCYGVRLPFYPIGVDYLPDEVNKEDICFLLWHATQQYFWDEQLISPESPFIMEAGARIYALLSKEYITAPENERMKEYFSNVSFSDTDFLVYRERVEWFHYHCYFNVGAEDDYMNQIDAMLEEVDVFVDDDGLNEELLDKLHYDLCKNLMLSSRCNLLSLTSPEWLTLIWKHNGVAPGPWEQVEVEKPNYYLYMLQDDEAIYACSLCGDLKKVVINKKSLNDNMLVLKSRKTVLTCRLVKFGTYWYVNGVLMANQKSEVKPLIEDMDEQLTGHHRKYAYEQFRKASKGSPLVYFKDRKDAQDFILGKMRLQIADWDELFEDGGEDGFFLMASPATGLHLQQTCVNCICSPDNPVYDKAEAEMHSFIYLTDPLTIPYELSCLLQDRGMLPDVCADGRDFLKDNARFVTDYFFHKRRDKDAADLEAWSQ